MLLVAIDTSGRKGSIALCRGDHQSFEVLQFSSLEGGTYSAQLMPRIAGALERNALSKSQIDGFVIIAGPGSFTGLRVGLATVKGLCEALGKPLATVSMLEAVARARGTAGRTAIAVLDAGRGEVFVGEYRVSGDRAELEREYIAKLTAFIAESSTLPPGLLFTPDESVAEALRTAGIEAQKVAPVRADEIGRIGLCKLLSGEIVDPATVDANYIRRSDAELCSLPKRTNAAANAGKTHPSSQLSVIGKH